MSLRFPRSTGPAVLALLLGTALALGLPLAAPAGAATAGGPSFTLLWQTAFVQPSQPGGTATLTLDLGTGGGISSGDEVAVSLYRALPTRSQFEQTLTSAPAGPVLAHTTPVPLSGLPAGQHQGLGLGITVEPSTTATPAPAAGAPVLDLDCTPSDRSCTGVYPMVVSLVRPADNATLGKFTTYLTYAQVKSQQPLQFAWVVPMAAPVTIHHGARDPATAIAAPSKATATALDGLVDSLAKTYPQVPVTVEPAPQTLQALEAAGGASRQAVHALADMSDDQAVHEVPVQSYVPISLGTLAGGGEPTEITGQMKEGAAVLHSLKVGTSGTPPTWVATGAIGSALGTGLAKIGANHVVVPDTALATDTSSTNVGTWSSTFQLSLGKGSPALTAATSDGVLAGHFTAEPDDPALEANQLLADLAMIHFEEPNLSTVRGVVVVPPSGWVPNTTFDDQLLAGLTANPVVAPVTLDSFFSAVHGAGARHLQSSGTGPVLGKALAHQVTTARLRLTGFDTAVQGSPAVLTQLDQLLLASEAANLRAAAQSAGVDTFGHSLDTQLDQIAFATEHTITLTARTGSIPITVVSSAPYTVVGKLSVTSDKLEFPQGSARSLKIDHPTNPVRIQVEARSSGDLPIQAVFETADGNLVIAQAQLSVRSTATSIVGVVLTGLALVVLLAWWGRTWLAGRRRRAAQGRRAASG